MNKIIGSSKAQIILVLIIALAVGGYSLYRSRSTKLLDKTAYREFRTAVKEIGDSEAGGFADQAELSRFIKDWADARSLEYSTDKAGNIIFDRPAAGRKKNITPTLVCVSMNYETAVDNARLLAAAAAIALSDIEAGRKTVVFVNDEKNLGKGYKGLSREYLSSKAKVIYLDYGSSSYLSTASFQERFSRISVPAEKEPMACDTVIKVKISGLSSGVVGPAIGSKPDPVSAFSALLTRLKSRSAIYRLVDVSIGSNGNMYPVSMECTIALNSYAVNSFTGYIDKRKKAWEKAYGKDNEDFEYSYEVIDDPKALPEETYSADVTDRLAGILYTIKTGAYRYSESDAVPEGRDKGDIYGINCLLDLTADDEALNVKIMTQGVNDSFADRIMYDNKAAAELYDCRYRQTEKINEFLNERNSLSRNFKKTYTDLSDVSSSELELPLEKDNFFTPCSYLAEKSSKADIIHVRMNSETSSSIANAVLCYIKTKGNTSFF